MKRSAKAVLLSALVFPGVGHFYLKRFATGLVLLVIAGGATYYLIANAVRVALRVSDKIAAGEIALDAGAISNLVAQQSQQVAVSSSIATYVVVAAWLIAMIDSYRVGIALERNQIKPYRNRHPT